MLVVFSSISFGFASDRFPTVISTKILYMFFLFPWFHSVIALILSAPVNLGDHKANSFVKSWTVFDVLGQKFKGRSHNKFRMHIHVFWVICVEIWKNSSDWIVSPPYLFSTYFLPRLRHHIVGRAFLFPVHICPCPLLSNIVSHFYLRLWSFLNLWPLRC